MRLKSRVEDVAPSLKNIVKRPIYSRAVSPHYQIADLEMIHDIDLSVEDSAIRVINLDRQLLSRAGRIDGK